MRHFYWVALCGLILGVAGCWSGQEGESKANSGVPSLDDARVLWVYDAGTTVLQTGDGKLFLEKTARAGNDENRARLAEHKSAFEYPVLRAGVEGAKGWPGWGTLGGVERDGRAWYVTRPDGKSLTLYSSLNGVVERKEFPGERFTSVTLGETCKPSAGWYGNALMVEKEGGITTVGLASVREYRDGRWLETPVERADRGRYVQNARPDDGAGSYYATQIYRDGSVLWVVRSFATNSPDPGSVVMRVEGGKSMVAYRMVNEYVTGLVRHANGMYALIEKPVGEVSSTPAQFVPARVQRITEAKPGDAYAAGSRGDEVMGYKQARLLFITADGTQILQAWRDTRPAPVLLLVTARFVRQVETVSTELGVDCQGTDGAIYLHDQRNIYRMDMKTGALAPCLALGKAGGQNLFVAAVDGPRICLGRRLEERLFGEGIYFWVDTRAKAREQVLGGELVSRGMRLAPSESSDSSYPIAQGPDGTVWAIAYQDGFDEAIYDVDGVRRMDDGRIFRMTLLGMSGGRKPEVIATWSSKRINWTVWPMNQGQAMVVSSDSYENERNAMYFNGKSAVWYETLKNLLEAQHERLNAVMPNGVAYGCGQYAAVYLVRINDGFYMADGVFRTFSNGGGLMAQSGVFQGGQWVKWKERRGGEDYMTFRNLIDRPITADIKTGRLMGIVGGWKSMDWIPVAQASGREEAVNELREMEGVRYWNVQTELPREKGCWITARDSAARAAQMARQRKEELIAQREFDDGLGFDVIHNSSDFGGFETWDGDRQAWRNVDMSFYGSRLEEDLAGNLWLVRNREVEVISPEGKRQLIPVDSCTPRTGMLAPQTRDVLWLFTRQSAFGLVNKAGVWVQELRLSLREQGFDVNGVWISGKTMYYRSNGGLFQVDLDEKKDAQDKGHGGAN